MAVKFIEPGGDADFGVNLWSIDSGAPAVATDFVHGSHIKSIKYRPAQTDVLVKTAILGNSGRVSTYLYFNAFPDADSRILYTKLTAGGTTIWKLIVSSTGVLKLFENSSQVGSDGATLSTGTWYRISVAWNLTSTSVNDINVFVNGSSSITAHNVSLTSINPVDIRIGNGETSAALDFRSSDFYLDDSNALTDPGNIWATAKRPNANGTAIDFTTQIGSGGSGYGSGHSPQVNERALSTTNGWSLATTSSTTKNEEYNIENAATGDINITGSTIVGVMGWMDGSLSSTTSQTGGIIVDGTYTAKSLTTSAAVYTQISPNPTTYPAGTGTDIGMRKVTTTTTSRTGSLFECGIIIAYIPAVASTNHFLSLMGVGA